jgi:hypothetical protein
MREERIAMSRWERDVVKVMAPVLTGHRTQVEASRLLGLSTRQVRRIGLKLRSGGDGAMVHTLRGRPSNRRLSKAFRQKVLSAYRAELMGFGPTFAAEKLAERGLGVSARTLREWLVVEGLWQRQRRRDRHRSRRERRACFGELVQADGSHHDWLEGRGESMVLLVMIDDATSRMVARFYPAETTEGYMDLLKRYLRKHRRMVALYTDHDSVFVAEDAQGQPVLTQFGRALEELGIQLILAGSPQAKGRVERSHGTTQDRLVKELRLAKATTLQQANEVLERGFLPWFNRSKTVRPASPNNAHRPLHPSMSLSGILSIQERRKVCNDYTIRLDGRTYQLLPPALPGLRGGWVTVEKRFDGSLHLRFKGKYLKHKACPLPTPSGALPPNPRSLPLGRTPAEPGKKEGHAVSAAQPSAVRPPSGRSGRTPAEPCLPKGQVSVPAKQPYRPPPQHPWRQTGHFKRPRIEDISIGG